MDESGKHREVIFLVPRATNKSPPITAGFFICATSGLIPELGAYLAHFGFRHPFAIVKCAADAYFPVASTMQLMHTESVRRLRNIMAKINRFSCKCKLCKAKWTTEESDRTRAFNAHEASCPKYTLWLTARVRRPERIDSERYQMAALYFEHLQIEGRLVADKKCDGRCMHATGHTCECSCGGANHGIQAAA